MWRYDPATQQASLVADLDAQGGSDPYGLVVLDGALYFAADEGESSTSIWRYDASTNEARAVTRIEPNRDRRNVRILAVYSGQLYFNDAASGALMRYDPQSEQIEQAPGYTVRDADPPGIRRGQRRVVLRLAGHLVLRRAHQRDAASG